jgi:cytochrome P450
MPIEYDPFSESARIDPFPAYKQLRDEAPVYWCESMGAWFVSRYRDARDVLTRPDLFSSDAMASTMLGIPPGTDLTKDPRVLQQMIQLAQTFQFGGEGAGIPATLITADPPKHDHMRAIVNRGFTPRRVADWDARIRAIVDELMARLASEPRFDVVGDFAVPLPMTVIAEMLGVEHERRKDFKRWTDGIVGGLTGSGQRAGVIESGFATSMGELGEYLRGAAEDRRDHPQDDLISVLVRSQEEEVLTPTETVLFGIVLLVAGNETTTNLIGSTVNQLLEHPDQLQMAVDDPSLIPNVVEEALRTQSPVQILFRRATREVEIAGQRLPENSIVGVLLGAANRDERQFEDPDRFDLTRDASGHLAFGFGIHFCLGASLARMEARAAFEALVPELPTLERTGVREYGDSYLFRGLRRLELRRRT